VKTKKLTASAAAPWIYGSAGDDGIDGTDGHDRIDGLGGDDSLYGGEGNDHLVGGDGSDLLDGGTGVNIMDGGAGIDEAAIDRSDQEGGFSVDLTTGPLITLSDGSVLKNIEILYYKGGAGTDVVGGAGRNDFIQAGSGDDIVSGRGGADILYGGEGNDVVNGDAGNDVIYGGLGVDVLNGGDHDDQLEGDAGDTFNGGAGIDYAGIDVSLSAGTNILGTASGVTYTLTDGTKVLDIERFSYDGGSGTDIVHAGHYNDALYGNAGNDQFHGGGGHDLLAGGSGNDLLDGGTGGDTMVGETGNDIYIVDQTGDDVYEADDEGLDTVKSAVSFKIESSIERLALTGSGDIDGTGNALSNEITGNKGANRIDGGAGADAMRGGAGDDVYIVDNVADRVTEKADEGQDRVDSSVSFSLAGQYVETLHLTGTANVNGTGNNLANDIVGNSGANVLNGAGGEDRLEGGAGNDRYVVDTIGDIVVEAADGGVDRVESAASYTLGDHVENLFLTGTATVHATGNALANVIQGNGAGNIIDGGAGADLMAGKGGNDRYIVDDAGDKVTELAGEGDDTVESSVSFTLAGQYIETLRLTGGAAVDATGNGQANDITGNMAANRIDAGGGDDRVNGGTGNDILTGGAGKDRFVFDSQLSVANNVDTITDFSSANDAIYLDRSRFTFLDFGVLSEEAFAAGPLSTEQDDRIVYDSASGRIWYDEDGSAGGAAILFAQVEAGTILTAADFVVF